MTSTNSGAIWRMSLKIISVIFLLERHIHYVRVFDIANPSVCLSSVTFMHPTQAVEAFGNISSPLCTSAILWFTRKMSRRSS